MFEKPNPIAEKYARIDLSGREAINDNNIREFPGFSADLKRNTTTVMDFTPEDKKEIKERVTDQIKKISSECGIEVLLAGVDYPIHATVLEGSLVEGAGDDEKIKILNNIQRSKDFKQVTDILEGLQIEFKYLLLDRGNILLASIDIPQEVLEARKKMEALYRKKKYTFEAT